MSHSPICVKGNPGGKMGNDELVDLLIYDGLWIFQLTITWVSRLTEYSNKIGISGMSRMSSRQRSRIELKLLLKVGNSRMR